jgi:23S rRNA (adenine2030-N6)-methyltransferase
VGSFISKDVILLSYRHAYHAGNHADVLKHAALTLTLQYYQQKAKPFGYFDTHAGAGMYALQRAEAQKTQEYSGGILRLWQASQIPAVLQPYLNLIQQANQPNESLKVYPGSPWLAAQCLNQSDHLSLYELHPTDYQYLSKLFAQDKRCKISKQDGLTGLISQLPPNPRRAVILIDPSYEVKTDYDAVIKTLQAAYKRFATGTYILWYPVIERVRVHKMQQALKKSGIANILQAELCVQADQVGLGMTGSGLFIINPPWILAQQLNSALPWLSQHLAITHGSFTLTQLTPENA